MTKIDMAIEPKSDQLNADDLIGGPRTITITKVTRAESADQPIKINFDGDNGRPWKPCKTMRKIMVAVWGDDGSQYVGNRVTLYLDPFVKWGGAEVGGIRISHMSGITEDKTIPVTVTRGRKAPWTVKTLPDDEPEQQQITEQEAQEAARAAATGGSDAFTMWWNTEFGKSCREIVKPIMEELKKIAAEKDSQQ